MVGRSWIDYQNNRGNVLRDLRRSSDALAAFEKAAELDSGNPLPHNNRGLVLADLESLDAALQAYDRAIELDSTYASARSNRDWLLGQMAARLQIADLPTEGRRLSVGEVASGELPDGSAQAWEFAGVTGQTVTIELISDDFDPYLHLAGPGIDPPLEDDDSAGNYDALIRHEFTESGTYRVVVSAYNSGRGGNYRLRAIARD